MFADELLGPVFLDVARADLAVRLPVMCDSPRDPHVGVHDHLARDTWFVRVTATYRAERR